MNAAGWSLQAGNCVSARGVADQEVAHGRLYPARIGGYPKGPLA
jgi:hypothetical protein